MRFERLESGSDSHYLIADRTRAIAFALPLLSCIFAGASVAQTTLHSFAGNGVDDFFGIAARGAGDVDGDGFADIIVGAPSDNADGQNRGAAYVYSGFDGRVLHTFRGEPFSYFGRSADSAGDVDGDGLADVIIGSGVGHGAVGVFSGVDGRLIVGLRGGTLTTVVSTAGDVDGDGFSEVIIGAPDDSNELGLRTGIAQVYSVRRGRVLYTFEGIRPFEEFGAAVGSAGDVNGDGLADVIIGSPRDAAGETSAGSARVFSGRDGSLIHHLVGRMADDRFGGAVAGAGDVDGDGRHDLIVGAWADGVGGFQTGSAQVFSGRHGGVLEVFQGAAPGDRFGYSVSGAGDVNGDGLADVAVGAPRSDANGLDSGSAFVLASAGAGTLYTFVGEGPGVTLGTAAAPAGDVNGDGLPDLVLASERNLQGNLSGIALVVSTADSFGTHLCPSASPNSTGAAGRILATGSPTTSNNALTLTAEQLPPDQFGCFLVARTWSLGIPVGLGSGLCLSGEIGRFDRTDQILHGPTGSVLVDLNALPLEPIHAVSQGESWSFQAWYRDVGSTTAFTNAVSVTFR